ncbi:anti-sigma regulatory factor [Methanocalculus sp.]|jgi:serine/threonine-protein kinase RsbT|uniref:anti-sigma regulatory factor n=1 Tax=Methanocalculus sp. TaxID=2004547 RepID=UPI0027253D46|nr:anti-sigma regulatory factor [Methanocalculus sp.]MDO8842233.1 anti-sigma regulatory factor [Methanocalculus sp.]
MSQKEPETIEIKISEDILRARQSVRTCMVDLGFSLIDQTKMVTAASELARNTIDYGKGGTMRIEYPAEEGRTGIRLIFLDHGPGIADIQQALKDGFTTGSGLGLGLGGSKRLVNDFEIRSEPDKGTQVTVTRWR